MKETFSKSEPTISGWPTCRANDAEKRGTVADDKRNGLVSAANLAGWQTPKQPSGGGQSQRQTEGGGLRKLEDQALLTSWATPTSRDYKDGGGGGKVEVNCLLGRQVLLTDSGQTQNGSTAEMGNTGQLNPAHSRWLQGLKPEWDACAVMAMRSMPSKRKRSSKQLLSVESEK